MCATNSTASTRPCSPCSPSVTRYVTRMAEIKTDPHEAHDPVRIDAILQRQRKRADDLGLDEDQAS